MRWNRIDSWDQIKANVSAGADDPQRRPPQRSANETLGQPIPRSATSPAPAARQRTATPAR